MYNDTEKFVLKGDIQTLGVIPNSLHTNEDFGFDGVVVVWKSKDVGIIVMIEMLLIQFQDILIRTKDISNIMDGMLPR